MGFLLFLLHLGMPISWKKLSAGLQLEWTGQIVDFQLLRMRPSIGKLDKAIPFILRLTTGAFIRIKYLQSFLGLLEWLVDTAPTARRSYSPSAGGTRA